jgi:hypothetical protein
MGVLLVKKGEVYSDKDLELGFAAFALTVCQHIAYTMAGIVPTLLLVFLCNCSALLQGSFIWHANATVRLE